MIIYSGNDQTNEDYKNGEYALAGGVIDPLPEEGYHAYYKMPRGYHKRSLNSNVGWAIQTNISMMNVRLFHYANEIRSVVMIVHGDKTHSSYMGKDAYDNMIKNSKYTNNKELVVLPGAIHTELYDQFAKIENFLNDKLKL